MVVAAVSRPLGIPSPSRGRQGWGWVSVTAPRGSCSNPPPPQPPEGGATSPFVRERVHQGPDGPPPGFPTTTTTARHNPAQADNGWTGERKRTRLNSSH